MRREDPGAEDATKPLARSGPRRLSLLHSLLYFVPSYGLAVVGYLALSALAGRVLGLENFGYYVLVFSASTLIGQFSLMGVHRSGLREAARADNVDALAVLRHGVRAVLLIPLPLGGVATGLVIFVWRGADAGDAVTAALIGLLVYFAGWQKVSANFLRGLGHVRAATMLTGRAGGPFVVLAQAVGVLLVYLFAPSWGLPGVLAGTAAGYLPALGWATWLLRRHWPPVVRHTRTLQDLQLVLRRDWRFTFSQTGAYLVSTLELWVAGAILLGPATSLFAAAQRMAHLLVVPSTSMQIVFSPALARLAKRDDHAHLEPLVRTMAAIAAVAAAVLWLPMVLAPGMVLTGVFGAGFEAAQTPLRLLATAYLLSAMSGPATATLSMSNHEGDVARINWFMLVFRLALGLFCAAKWGVTGLAASAAAMATLQYSISWWTVRRRLSISTHATLHPRLFLLRRISG